MAQQPQKIAVLGGGMSALAAVHALTNEPGWSDRYEITVYQVGWRLGGKTATGRGEYDRIEEHGIHILQGWYETTFKFLRSIYAERTRLGLDPKSPLQDLFTDGLQRNNTTLLTSFDTKKWTWNNWPMVFPESDDLPGDGEPVSFEDQLKRGLRILWDVLSGNLPTSVQHIAAKPMSMAFEHEDWIAKHPILLKIMEDVMNEVMKLVDDIVESDPDVHHFLLLLAMGYYNLKGLIADTYDKGSGTFDLTKIDHLDYREWLTNNGAPEWVTTSVIVRFFYTGTFSDLYNDHGGAIAADTALKFVLASFGYKGSFVFQFVYGTGDTMVMPVYQVLKSRGVTFKFFSEVTKLYDLDGGAVNKIDIGQQVALSGNTYDPIKVINDLSCWPSEPLYDQISATDAKRLKEEGINLEDPWSGWKNVGSTTLQRGVDFDHVILGIPIGVLPSICGEIIAQNSAWQSMIQNVKTTPTLSAQLWLMKDLQELGFDKSAWGLPPENSAPNVVTYQNPMYSWLDSSLVLPNESWPSDQKPKFLAYYTGVLPMTGPLPPYSATGYQQQQVDRMKALFLQWLNDNSAWFWPGGGTLPYPGGLDLSILAADTASATPQERYDQQYFRANVRPTDQYTLSVPGSNKHRLDPDGSGYANLWLCGDWVNFGINIGYIDGAIQSGQQAAAALVKAS